MDDNIKTLRTEWKQYVTTIIVVNKTNMQVSFWWCNSMVSTLRYKAAVICCEKDEKLSLEERV